MFKLFILTILLAGCASKPLIIKDCELKGEARARFEDIQELKKLIQAKTEEFDRAIQKGAVDLVSDKNYQELLALKSRQDEAINALFHAVEHDQTCLAALFKKDLNFPELSDEI